MRQAGEPTVEEILESIKKVIARDNRAEGAEERRRRENSGLTEKDNDGSVLDLAESAELLEDQEVDEPGSAALVDENAQTNLRESLAALSVLSAPGAPPQIVRSGETSLEGMARELLRPVLAEWLDKNLPALVERMVAAEIKRIVGKKS
jgi:cell pole-organizing protein PopZ